MQLLGPLKTRGVLVCDRLIAENEQTFFDKDNKPQDSKLRKYNV